MTTMTLRLALAFLLALILTILPMPGILLGTRPMWVLMLILYLQFYMPDCFNLFVLFMLGLILDTLLSTVIGEHTLALSLVTWIASSKARRFYFFSIGQQMMLMGFFCFLYQIIILTINAFLGYHVGFAAVIGSTAVSVLFWPWVRLIAEESLLFKQQQH